MKFTVLPEKFEKKSGHQGPWFRCYHCKKKFRSWLLLFKHWLRYCRDKRPGLPSIIECRIEDVYERDKKI